MEPSGLILSSDFARLGRDPRRLARQVAAGELARIRQGVYVPAKEWHALRAWEQYPLLIHAAAATLQAQTVFCRQSSAALWGIPLLGTQKLAHACTGDGGGGRSRAGVRRHHTDLSSLVIERRSGLLVTGRVRTALDLAGYESFQQGVVCFDHILKPDVARGLPAVSRRELHACLEFYNGAATRRILAALEFADPASGSAGESLSRALMHLGRFQRPVLQSEIRDDRGLAGFLDFDWPEHGLAGEFDGLVKYQKDEYLQGRSPSDVVIAEKRREDRIRAAGRRVIRWTWSELSDVGKFAAFLERAGVPRVPRPSSRR
jgi:hypothetical protein